jgi:hypothetical protein
MTAMFIEMAVTLVGGLQWFYQCEMNTIEPSEREVGQLLDHNATLLCSINISILLRF